MYVRARQGFVKEQGLEIELISAAGATASVARSRGRCPTSASRPEVPMYIYNGESADKPLMFAALHRDRWVFLVSKAKIEKFDWSMLNGRRSWRSGPAARRSSASNSVEAEQGRCGDHQVARHNIGPAARDGAWLAGGFDFALCFEPTRPSSRRRTASRHHLDSGWKWAASKYTSFFARRAGSPRTARSRRGTSHRQGASLMRTAKLEASRNP